ncbi:MAG: PilZ domain-containing protein [Hyphomicrobiaceae bacterium]
MNPKLIEFGIADCESKNSNLSDDRLISGDRRRRERQSVNWPARCIFDDKEWDVVIVDASNDGFGLNFGLPLAVGTDLQIFIDQVGQFRCRIIWSSDTRTGLELLSDQGDLSPDQADELSSLIMRLDQDNFKSISELQLNKLVASLK